MASPGSYRTAGKGLWVPVCFCCVSSDVRSTLGEIQPAAAGQSSASQLPMLGPGRAGLSAEPAPSPCHARGRRGLCARGAACASLRSGPREQTPTPGGSVTSEAHPGAARTEDGRRDGGTRLSQRLRHPPRPGEAARRERSSRGASERPPHGAGGPVRTPCASRRGPRLARAGAGATVGGHCRLEASATSGPGRGPPGGEAAPSPPKKIKI